MASLAFVWLGLVLGVSFLATPVKFRAPSLTRPVALDVGRTTFHAFGKVEWVASAVLVVAAVATASSIGWPIVALVAAVVALVVFQTAWMIPRLDVRVQTIIDGGSPPPSRLHTVYAGSEGAKALLLLAIGLLGASG
ncbi:MAG: DUF4149 domain-containing protein [Actinomycetota bacterium]